LGWLKIIKFKSVKNKKKKKKKAWWKIRVDDALFGSNKNNEQINTILKRGQATETKGIPGGRKL